MRKAIRRLYQEILNLPFYRHRTNWHKIPGVRTMLCKVGRHDYEFVSLRGDQAVLECFYCDHGKIVTLQSLTRWKASEKEQN